MKNRCRLCGKSLSQVTDYHRPVSAGGGNAVLAAGMVHLDLRRKKVPQLRHLDITAAEKRTKPAAK
jgi:hypothetical protein